MARKEISTTLTDIDGESHDYEALVYEPDLAVSLMADLFGPILGGGTDAETLGAGELAGLAAKVATDTTGLLDRIFSGCRRRGSDGKWEVLSKKGDRTKAYAGNLGELVEAIKWVLSENFGPFLTQISQAVSEI